MRKILFIYLFCVNFIYAQDTASNKAFPKFLSDGSNNHKTFIDENGIETIVSIVSGKVAVNNTILNLKHSTLMIFRHHIIDSMNYTYSYVSDTAKDVSSTGISDICKTKNSVGFIINFYSFPINLKYPVFSLPPKKAYNTVYLEFDSLLNLTDYAKFGGNSEFNIYRLVSDENNNKYAFAIYQREIEINDSVFLCTNKKYTFSIFSFIGNKINWTSVFDTVNTKSVNALQFASKKNELYAFLQFTGRNIEFDGHLLSRTSMDTYSLLKLDSLGRFINEIETDSLDLFSTYMNSMLVSDDLVFLSISYYSYLKIKNRIFTRKAYNNATVLFEMDLGLNIKNELKLSSLAQTVLKIKTYDEDYKLLYLDIEASNSVIIPLVINDTIQYFNNFGNYPNYNQAHTLFSYSTIKKALVSSYDFTMGGYSFFDVCCHKSLNSKVYSNLLIYGNIKLEGKIILDNTYRGFSFTLNKPSVFVVHPSGFIPKRRQKDLTELVWVNNEIYDSLEVQKYSMLSHKIEFTTIIKNSPVFYSDSTLSLANGNYYYKIRGYRKGEYSIWVGSDSSSTTDSLALEKYLYASIVNERTVILKWGLDNTRSNNFFYREVYRSENRYSGFQRIALLSRSTQSYLDTMINKDKIYYYFVRDYTYMFENSTDTVMVKFGSTLNSYGNYFEVYPNPSYNKMYFNLSDKSSKTFTVIDSRGRTMIFTLIESNGKYFADVSGLENGVYTITYLQNGSLYTKRFVKL